MSFGDAALSRKAILTEIGHSLRRLGTDYVDLYQIHRWDPHTPIEETLEALHDVVQGRQSALRRSFVDVHVAVQQGPAHVGAPRLDAVREHADHYNLLNREEEREMLPLCADQSIAVLPIAQGRDVPRAQVALAWLLSKSAVTSPIAGVTKMAHLNAAIAAVDVELTGDEIASLEEPYTPHPVVGF